MSINTVTPTENARALCERIEARLDEVQSSLPAFPAAWLSLNRAVFERVASTANAVASRLGEDVGRLTGSANTALATATGQARSGLERVGGSVERAAKETAGQARSGVERIGETVGRTAKQTVGQARSGADRVGDTVERTAKETAGQAGAQARTVAEEAVDTATDLVEDAERTIHPTKAELDSMTKAELYDRAQTLDIEGRSTMDKGELIDAIVDATS